MEVAEVPGSALFFIQIAQGDVQSHGAIPHGSRVELSGRYLEARIEIHGPFDDVSFAAGLRFGDRFLRAAQDPLLVRVPRRLAAAWLAFEKSAHADSAFAGLGEVADHLPG